MQAKRGDYFKTLGPGNAYTVVNAVETRGLDKLAYLAVREVSVESWDQKAERGVKEGRDKAGMTVNTEERL